MVGPLQKRHLAKLTQDRSLPVGPWLTQVCATTELSRWEAIAAALLRMPTDAILKRSTVYAGAMGSVSAYAAARVSLEANLSIEAFTDGILVRLCGLSPGIDGSGTPTLLWGSDWTIKFSDGSSPGEVVISVPNFVHTDGTLDNERVFVAFTKALPELLATGVGFRRVVLDGPERLVSSVVPTEPAAPEGVDVVAGAGVVHLDARVEAAIAGAIGAVPGRHGPGGDRYLDPVGARMCATVISKLVEDDEHGPLAGALRDGLARCRALGWEQRPMAPVRSIAAGSGTIPWSVTLPTGPAAPRMFAASARLPRQRIDASARGKMLRKVAITAFLGPMCHPRLSAALVHGYHLKGDPYVLPVAGGNHGNWTVIGSDASHAQVTRLRLTSTAVRDGGALLGLFNSMAQTAGRASVLLVDRATAWPGRVG